MNGVISQRAGPADVRRTGPPLWVVDVLLAAVFTGLPIVAITEGPLADQPDLVVPVLVGAVVNLPLILLRRWRPFALLGVAVVVMAGSMAATDERTPLMGAVLVLTYTVADRVDRRSAMAIGAGVATATYLAQVLLVQGAGLGGESLASLAWVGVAVAAAVATRSRREYLAEVEGRLARAEDERDCEAERRVVEERLRIARELHDVVAHQLAVVNVQAAAAGQLLRSDPEAAADALETVRTAAASVLDELGGVLHVLRATDDPGAPDGPDTSSGAPTTGAPLEPLPTLGGLVTLVASYAAAGLTVNHRLGSFSHLPEAVQLAGYRIVQEALTNAQRHGAGTATLRVEVVRGALGIEVLNPVTTGAAVDAVDTHRVGSGLGLIGVRERAEALGGSIELGPTEAGEFRLSVVLPVTTGAGP